MGVLDRWLAGLWGVGDYTLYRLGWDLCILAGIGRWVVCSGGCFLRFHCRIILYRVCIGTRVHLHKDVRTSCKGTSCKDTT